MIGAAGDHALHHPLLGGVRAGRVVDEFLRRAAEQRAMGHGSRVPASWFPWIKPGVLILVGPLFAAGWTALGRRGREPSAPAEMTGGDGPFGPGVHVHGRRRPPGDTVARAAAGQRLVADGWRTRSTRSASCACRP